MADISKEFERKQEIDTVMRPDDNLALKVLNKNLATESKETKKPTKHRDVEALLKKGFTLEQIAKELNIGIGEVQLIAELMKVKNE